ncbi:MAG: T9SS type A sorting domain-containing protein [Bacteroidales bacterium]|nr:T9SS type A sorting domain-containing protein [Bacteroidales bacterium]
MKKTLLFLLILYAMPYAFSQTVTSDIISTSGSSLVAEGFTMSWTIGENIVDYYQDYSAVNEITKNHSELLMQNGTRIMIYPTMTKGPVYIKIRSENHTVLQAELFNLKGSLLRTIHLEADENEENLGDLLPGTYIIRISDPDLYDRKIVKVFKY